MRFKRLTLKIRERVEDQEKRRMVAVVRELPTTGYALEVDGRLKTEFETREGARSRRAKETFSNAPDQSL